MSDDNSDKTRINFPPAVPGNGARNRADTSSEDGTPAAIADDKTRIGPARSPSDEVAPDKTRISFPDRGRVHAEQRGTGSLSEGDQAEADGDKTRIGPARNGGDGSASDKTNPGFSSAPRIQRVEEVGGGKARDDAAAMSPTDKAAADRAENVDGAADSGEAENVTRFNARPVVPEDKTRMRPLTSGETAGVEPITEGVASDNGEYDILKGRFVLEEVLGAGGMGVVYKAKDLLKVEAQDRDPYVAIKVLGEEFKTHPEAFISLQRESRKSQRIAHPNIVNVHDFDRDGDTVFMTMEFMEGAPLDKLIKQYKSTGLPTDDAWNIIEGMSLALAHAHAERIVHSDFKPGNVFVTNKGVAKVFDFGISRAVAIAEHTGDNPEDKTLFDAGTLGALTPAYASLEMLQGKKPDVRDDVFALGCVAYEMLTGGHPYNRVPADEAEKQGLKPKRITNIKKFQWKAIEHAIALRREDRTESVEKFINELSPKIKSTNRLVTVVALLVLVGVAVYLAFFQEKTVNPDFDPSTLKLELRIEFYKDNLATLLKEPTFDDNWQASVWKDVSELISLTENKDPWVIDQKTHIYKMYLSKIDEAIKRFQLNDAKQLLVAARRYTDEQAELDLRAESLDKAFAQLKARNAKQAEADSEKRRAAEKEQQAGEQNSKKKVDLFNLALANVNLQLKCQGRLNMSDLESAVTKLRQIDLARYKTIENRIVAALGECIMQIGKAFPERANEAKKYSLRIFGSNTYLADIKIKPRDVCDLSLAGLGARGYRAVCKDKLKGGKIGPDLVVIPGKGSIEPFAIGKFETSIRDLNLFCKESGECRPITNRDDSLPASNIPFEVAKKYMNWLSKESGQKYRLPTRNEWRYAANAKRARPDPNRNCKLSARGIQKGDGLVDAAMGQQNDWGVVNYVGNVQEWVYDKGRTLVAVGGSYKDPMDSCGVDTVHSQSGSADADTGFRVLREIRSN